MSIFGKIKTAIFGHPAAAATASSAPSDTPAPSASSAAEPAATTAAPVGGTGQAIPSTAGAAPAPAPGTTPGQSEPVEIAPVLDAAVQRSGQKLDWKHSIVDLMKALGMDASLSERKELADELGYSGDKNDSASMNMWLHKELMKKLSENGGKVPAELLD